MTTAELLKARTSIRAYRDTPVSEELVRGLLDTARWAPSGGNLQPWKVIVVAGEELGKLTELAFATLGANPGGEAGEHPIYPQPLGEPYRTRRFQVGEEMYALLGIAREDKAARLGNLAKNYTFWGAPVSFFFVIDRQMGHGQWAHLGMFMQSLALAAQEQGLSTCMQEAWGMVRDALHGHFELPEEELVYCGMTLGYADEDAPVNALRSTRAEVAEFATFRGFQR